MTVPPVTSSQTPNNSVTPPVTNSAKTLGPDDFMKLLAVQFQQQDPMKPMDDTAFIAQMAQFTALSQTQTMTAEMTKLQANQSLATANSYLGKQVTVDNGDGTTSAGVVSGVQVDSNVPSLVVGDYAYPLSAVLSVAPAPDLNAPLTPPATTVGS